MNARRRKTLISQLFSARFRGPPIWRSAEERAWLDAVPVGREFGSPDFDRLMREDRENRVGVFSECFQKSTSYIQDDGPLTSKQLSVLRADSANNLPQDKVLLREDLFK